MIAREWKARCPKHHTNSFVQYLHETGVQEARQTKGYRGSQILLRELAERIEITLITYWDSYSCIKLFAGEQYESAKLYPDDCMYELDPDKLVTHYQVIQHTTIS